jgi:hypothetical protein
MAANLQLRGSGNHLRMDESDAELPIHDYRGYIFDENNTPKSLAGFVLDRIALDSLLRLKAQGHEISFRKAVFYQTDFSHLSLTGLDFSHAKFTQCSFYRSTFTQCNLKSATVSSDCAGAMFKNCELSYANFTGARNLTGEKIFHNKGVMEAKFIDTERLIKEAHKQEKQKPSKRFSNLFGDHEGHYTPPKHSHKPKPMQTYSFVDKLTKKKEGPSEQAQAANRLFRHIAEEGEGIFCKKIQRQRTAIRKELLSK